MAKKTRFGKAFLDQFQRSSFTFGHFHHSKESTKSWYESLIPGFVEQEETAFLNPWRKISLSIFLMLTFAALFFRLFHLQVVEGTHNRALADSNRIKIKIIHAPRGVIYDRNGKVLARNDPGWRLIEVSSSGEEHATFVDRDQALKMEVNQDFKFKDLEVDSIRGYPYGRKMSHILGYVGEITQEELDASKQKGNITSIAYSDDESRVLNYKLGDKVGRGGIEQEYEKVLRGTDGGEVFEVDAQGKKIRTIREKKALPGQNIYLTIDADLQQIAYQKLEEQLKKVNSCCGSLIIQQPKTGQVLSLVSYPSFDPVKISDSLNEPNSPFLNRAIAGTYPPGSTFKIATALAGLSSGKINSKTQFEDTGIINLGQFKFANWYFTEYGKTEGQVDIIKALKRSNDIFFYQLGQLTGEKILGDTAKKLGFGKKLGIDIPGEEAGNIPDNNWKIKTFNEIWFPGDTLHMAIGQGFVLTTPLQINNLVSFIAADGKQYPPLLALKITDPFDKVVKEYHFDPINSEKFKDSDLQLIKTGLAEVPVSGGTAWPFFTFPIKTAGKTGTAEFGDPKNHTHAWYTSYAPLDDPQISMTVMIEAGGEGSNTSAPVSKEIYRWYFSQDKKNLIKDIGFVATESAKTLGE